MELIGLLMREHRLIEQIISPLETELKHISHQNMVHPIFIYNVVDFFKTYTDRYHHGKEEDILFKESRKKELTPKHIRIINELEEEHRYARRTVGELVEATEKWSHENHDALNTISNSLRKLIELYPRHIEKEDKYFFFPSQEYFSKEERNKILQQAYYSTKNSLI